MAARPHSVLMKFNRAPNGGWIVKFMPSGSDWTLRVCRFADAEKIRSLWRRYTPSRMSEDVQIFEFALTMGSGAVELRLGDEEMAKLGR